MRTLAVLGTVAALGLAVAGLGTSAPSQPGLTGKCAKANLDLISEDGLTLATDNPAFPPWWGGNAGRGFETSNPYSGKGYESAVAYEVAKRLGFTKAEVTWKVVPFVKSYAPGKKTFDWYMAQVSYSPVRAKAVDFSNSYYFVNQAVVGIKGTAITKAKSIAALKPLHARGCDRHHELQLHHEVHQADREAEGLRHEQRRDHCSQEQADRRARGRLPQHRLHHRRAAADIDRRRPPAHEGDEGALRHGVREGLDARLLRQPSVGGDAGERHAEGSRRGGSPAARRC